MKNFFEYLGVLAIIAFSFFYTEKVALVVQSKNPVMQEIVEAEKRHNIEFVNATIEGDYIIPGNNGLKINATKSFRNMRSFGVFNEYYLVFNQITPDISVENNKDKIINSGNPSRKNIAIIFEATSDLSSFALQKGYKVNLLVNQSSYISNDFYEMINNEFDKTKFSDVEVLLNKNRVNKYICLVSDKNMDLCKKNGNYLISPTYVLSATNVVEVKNKINNGGILLIENSASLADFQLIVNQITYRGLVVVPISELISEVLDDK